MKPFVRLPIAAGLALAFPLALHAQTAEGPPTADVSFRLGRVELSGRATGPLDSRRLLTSVDVVGGPALQDAPVRNAFELFSRVPGVLLTDFNQGTTSGKPSFRGFNGEGEVNAVKLLIDGIPSNSNDGNMPYLDMVFPLEIERITTVRGTNDARYGLHSIAGNIDVATRRGGSATEARLGAGAYGLVDAQVARDVEAGGASFNGFFGTRRSDGWRDHSAAERTSLSGKAFWQPRGADWRVGVSARHHEVEAQEPGYLTAADARATPRRSYAFSATDGGERTMSQIALHADGRAGAALWWQAKVWQNRFDDRRWVRFSAGVSQQERFTDETHTGARATISWRPEVTALPGFALEAGIDTERQRDRSERYLTVDRARTSTTRDQAWTFDVDGVFAQAIVRPLPALELVPGLRIDTVRGHFENRLNATSAEANDYGAIRQPKISAVWTVVPGWAAYANWGRTFQVGVGAAAFKIPPRTSDLKPSINDGWEAGLKFASGEAIDGRIAAWQQKATDEVYRDLNNPSGDSVNIGATRRRGLDLHLRGRPAATVEAWGALTLQKAVILEPNPAAPATRGQEIDHVPHRLLNLGVDWQATPALKLSAWAQGQSSYFLERTNATGRFGAFTVLNAGASWTVTPAIQLDVQVKNLADRYREYVWWDGAQTLHSPGEGRALFAALRLAI